MLYSKTVRNGGNVMRKLFVVVFAVAAVLAGPACRKSAPAPVAKPAPAAPGRITGEIRPSLRQLGLNQTYTVEYVVHNGSSTPVKVQKLVTVFATLLPRGQEWRLSDIGPGQSATVATVTSQALVAGSVKLTATFVSDQGSFEAVPVVLDIAAAATPAPATGSITAIVSAAPNPVKSGQASFISYDLINGSNQDVLVASIHADSSVPFTRDSDGWLADRVSAGGRATILRRIVTRKEPGSFTYPAGFNTNRGMITAPSVFLAVEAQEQATIDTGKVLVAIVIAPNPARIDQPYVIDYQVINTTSKPVTVTAIQTDIGTYQTSGPEWVSSTAGPNMTTVIARLRSTGMAIGGRTKTAVFSTSAGMLPASPVVLTVER